MTGRKRGGGETNTNPHRKILKPETLNQDSTVYARVKARGNFVILNKKYLIFIISDSFTVTTDY
jgi:predicted RNA-binding protein (virulence factor B family)